MDNGLDGVVKNEQILGLWVNFDMLYYYVEMFVSLRVLYYQRVVNVSYIITFFGIWVNVCLGVYFISKLFCFIGYI